MNKVKKENKFVLWVKGLSAYTKNKIINAFSFWFSVFIIGGINYCLMFHVFVPTFFLLDFLLIILFASPIFFFKKTRFDQIYLPIILFFWVAFYAINACYYDYFGTVLSIKDLPYIFQNIDQVKYNAGSISWWIVIVDVILFIVFGTGIVLYNALWKFVPSKSELNLKRRRKVFFGLIMLGASILSFEFSLQMWCLSERNKKIYDIDYVNYFPNYHFSNLGMASYYLQEVRQMIFDRGATVDQIKEYLRSGKYYIDDYTGLLSGNQDTLPANVLVIMIETGDKVMLNPGTTPYLWDLLQKGINCDHSYSWNHSDVSETLAINGSYPTFSLDFSSKYTMPFNLPNILAKEGYHSYYTADIVHENDFYNSMSFMKTFDFNDYWFHKEMIPNIQPWTREWDDYTRDRIFMDAIVDKLKTFPTDLKNTPFYLHYITICMHQFQDINDGNRYLFEQLEQYADELKKAEDAGLWSNPFVDDGKENGAYQKYRRWVLKTMDFDHGLGDIMNTLYGDDSPDYLKNTLLVVFGDHPWYEQCNNDETYAQHLKQIHDDENILQHSTILGMYHPKLNDRFAQDHEDHKFKKATWPSVIVPTILDLLNPQVTRFNPKMYQGKSLFDPSFDGNEVYYSLWSAKYMNEHYTSSNALNITKIINDNNTQKQFQNNLKEIRLQTRIFNTIYMNNIFEKHDYQDFLPPYNIMLEYDSKKIGLLI